jgi:hypothetical protein
MESRDWIQALAGARYSQSKISKTSVRESEAISGGVAETEALTMSGPGSGRFASDGWRSGRGDA